MQKVQKKDIWESQLRAGLITPTQYAKRKSYAIVDIGEGYVPYLGAIADVNIGNHNFIANNIVINEVAANRLLFKKQDKLDNVNIGVTDDGDAIIDCGTF